MSVNYVLDNGNFSQGGPVLENVLVAAGLRCGSVGVATSGSVTADGSVTANTASLGNSLILNGNPSVTFAGNLNNRLILNGVSELIYNPSFSAPQTAPAFATLGWNGLTFSLSVAQFAPLLNGGQACLSCYATTNTSNVNSQMVSRTQVSSFPLSQPAGSLAGISGTGAFGGVSAHTQVAAADVINCPTITANSALRAWVAGSTGNQLATAVTPATISNITPGTGFTLNGTPGVIYGYEVLYA